MAALSHDEQGARLRAQGQLEAIDELRRCRAFRLYYIPRLQDRIKTLESAILGKTLDFPKYQASLAALHALKEMESTLEQDEVACRSVLGTTKDDLTCIAR